MNETGEFSTLLREGPPSRGPDAAFLLSVVEGPDRGATLLVEPSLPSRVFVGTSSSCELRLGDREVARRHLAVEPSGQRLRVTDLGSASGTSADGVLLVEGFLRGGELLRIGRTAIAVERREASSSADASWRERFGRTIGASPEMQRLYPLCERFAASDVPVVVEGESGTGKEVLAEALHEQGPRAEAAFVVLDAATHAIEAAFEEAHRGTLLVDEIGDLDPSLQLRVLRAIERSPAVRVLVASRRDLDRLVETGRLREDLFERVNVARLELPPLRRRTGDVRRLALHFARAIGGPAATLPPELVAHWETDPWAGNVRALRDAVAHWLALADLAVESSAPAPDDLPFVQAREKVVSELELRHAERALVEHGGDVARAADASGLARRVLERVRARRARSSE